VLTLRPYRPDDAPELRDTIRRVNRGRFVPVAEEIGWKAYADAFETHWQPPKESSAASRGRPQS
jgi:hypothetical protein